MTATGRMKSLFTTVTVMLVMSIGIGDVAGHIFDLDITNAVLSPDGTLSEGILVNGKLDTFMISGQKGDQFHITVNNHLTSNLTGKSCTIHWHGMPQTENAWADGTSMITQCPIAPNHSFKYVFDGADRAGTYWYHSYVPGQYCDGLRGPFIIYDRKDPHLDLYDIDDESTVITLSEWYGIPFKLLPGPPTVFSTLINGVGRASNTSSLPLSVLNVKQGLKYRFRLINIGCEPNFVFSIEGHNMTVIEADGTSVEPVTVSSLQIFTGQRYSFVLHANQPPDNYWVRANPNFGPTGFSGGISSGILRYEGQPEVEPRGPGVQDTSLTLKETDLRPLDSRAAPGAPTPNGGADIELVVNIRFANDSAGLRFEWNGVSLVLPDVPSLLQILSGATDAADILPSGTVISVPRHKVLQVAFPVDDSVDGASFVGPHPLYLHGHVFDVIRSAGNETYNFINPPRRDVVSIGGPGSNVTIRFTTDNPGPWLFHCHINLHLELGLGALLVEDAPAIQKLIKAPKEWVELCDIYNSLPPGDQ